MLSFFDETKFWVWRFHPLSKVVVKVVKTTIIAPLGRIDDANGETHVHGKFMDEYG